MVNVLAQALYELFAATDGKYILKITSNYNSVNQSAWEGDVLVSVCPCVCVYTRVYTAVCMLNISIKNITVKDFNELACVLCLC